MQFWTQSMWQNQHKIAKCQQTRLLTTLDTHFGYTSFRPGQREIVEAILDGENVFAVFPTGHGKSLCYQLPGLMLDGITVVISPLISLMKDQVDALREQGIDAVSLINSTQTWEAYQNELARLRRNEIKLLYVSPERLRSRRFLDILNALSISLFVIDEAHCISQWGRDFRPAYLALRDTIDVLQPRVIALFTATAPPEIQEDIINVLNIPTPRTLTRGIERPNLRLSVQHNENDDEKYLQLEQFLREQNKNLLTADSEGCTHLLRKMGLSTLDGGAKPKRSQIFFNGVGSEQISITLDLNRKNAHVCKKPSSTAAGTD